MHDCRVEALAERSGYRVITWYEDHGLTGTESANRPEFRRLLSNAQSRKFVAVYQARIRFSTSSRRLINMTCSFSLALICCSRDFACCS
jgi:DNA invertase Pin-like site-specific DNA recombinase